MKAALSPASSWASTAAWANSDIVSAGKVSVFSGCFEMTPSKSRFSIRPARLGARRLKIHIPFAVASRGED
jgi:hypothetical protein